jgi:methionyl-tRNA formyltransferase
MDKRPWLTFFSQTGSEIADLSEKLGRWPSRIITNERPEHLRTIDPRIVDNGYITLPNKPTIENYYSVLDYYKDAIVTLHGWLRIFPAELCGQFETYNGHPGLITEYPELKGKDPQVRAFEGKYEVAGTVIHKVTAGVDEGEVILEERFNTFGLDLDGLFLTLRDRSLYMWTDFLEKKLDENRENRISWGI